MRSVLLLGLLLSAIGCVTPSLTKLEQSIVYQPVRHGEAAFLYSSISSKTPDVRDGFEEASFSVDTCLPWLNGPNKGETHYENCILHGWFAEATNPRAVVLYCHGNGGNVSNCAETMRMFRDTLHASVFAFDYRGYGGSVGGTLFEDGLYDDARAARKWLAKRTGVDEKDIVLCGFSLGGGVAVELAAKDGARGLILQNTFTSIPDVADSFVPLLPVGWLLESKYDSLSKIKDYRGPLLQTHGEHDSVVPYKLGKKLFQAANEPKEFVRIFDGDHNDPPAKDFIAALDRFFDELNKSGNRGADAPRSP